MVVSPRHPVGVRIRIDTLGAFAEEQNDLFFVYAEIIDENGSVVPTATDEIAFQLEGPGELIGRNPLQAEAGIASILFKGDIKKSIITSSRNAYLANN